MSTQQDVVVMPGTSEYMYFYIIYKNIKSRGTTYALRIGRKNVSEADAYMKQHFSGSAIYMATIMSDRYIPNEQLFKYPKHKSKICCAQMKSKSLFADMPLSSSKLLIHVITVELDYYFGKRLCMLPEHKDSFDDYMKRSGGYFGPLMNVLPEDVNSGVRVKTRGDYVATKLATKFSTAPMDTRRQIYMRTERSMNPVNKRRCSRSYQ